MDHAKIVRDLLGDIDVLADAVASDPINPYLIRQRAHMLSSGERVLADIALEIIEPNGMLFRAADRLDEDNWNALVTAILNLR